MFGTNRLGLATPQATNSRYRAKVASSSSIAQITDLLRRTDAVAEIHNTIRASVPVLFGGRAPWSY
jgi:hypothetical protein